MRKDGGSEIEAHDFKSAAFTIPTTCDLCQNTIWGLAKQGFTCKGVRKLYPINMCKYMQRKI